MAEAPKRKSVGRPKKIKLLPVDLSRYNDVERLPGNVIQIIKNALIIYKGDIEEVANIYNLDINRVNEILLENYLQINQIINTSMKSNELDVGIDTNISLLSKHVSEIKKQSKSNPLLKDSAVNQLTRITDRFLNAKSQYVNAYDKLVNQMITMDQKERMVQCQESGAIENTSDYDENLETVYTKLKAVKRKIKATNIKTKEVRHYPSLRACGDEFVSNPDYIRTKIQTKSLYKDEWAFEYED